VPSPAKAWLDTKKKTVTASERDEEARTAFRALIGALSIEDLVVIDEMGSSISLTRLYARAPKGQRAYGAVPRNHGTNTTLIGALTTDGLSVAMTLDGAVDTPAFVAFCEHILCPTLRPGQTVLLDNLAVHKSPRVRAHIEQAGCQILFLPAYSPDFAPIELAFAKIKGLLRGIGARTKEALEAAIAQVIDAVTPDDARAFFRHCGYHTTPQAS
jgi:transposase